MQFGLALFAARVSLSDGSGEWHDQSQLLALNGIREL
jgi:hypothetical protein